MCGITRENKSGCDQRNGKTGSLGVGATKTQSRESRNTKEEDELRLDSWIQIMSTGCDEGK